MLDVVCVGSLLKIGDYVLLACKCLRLSVARIVLSRLALFNQCFLQHSWAKLLGRRAFSDAYIIRLQTRASL